MWVMDFMMRMNYMTCRSIPVYGQSASDARSHMTAAILNLQRNRELQKGARMERLTYKAPDSEMVWFKDKERLFEPCEMSVHQSRLAITKLAAYEDAEEQGLLLRLPCKVGDSIYIIFHNHTIGESTVVSFRMIAKGWAVKTGDWSYLFTDFGKTVFLTKEEAEAKLAEMEGAK